MLRSDLQVPCGHWDNDYVRLYIRQTMACVCRQAAQLADAGARLAALDRDLARRQEEITAAEAAAATHEAREEVCVLDIIGP